jgi:polysaccharide pyruvyl transferase WcaK-like protein
VKVIASPITVGPLDHVPDRVVAAAAVRKANLLVADDPSSARRLRRLGVPQRKIAMADGDPVRALSL